MKKLKNFITPLHTKTKRNYIQRMVNNKIECMRVAKKYGKDYWDGNRKFGYGGYKYIPGRWRPVAKALIKNYKLGRKSKILDAGCGKGFLLYEMKLLEPELEIMGFDISAYATKKAPKEIRSNIFRHDISNKFPFKKNQFDLVISSGTLHNLSIFDVKKALKEIKRVGKSAYIMVESYRNLRELFNLQCWALTCEIFLKKSDWIKLFKEINYFGDYEFIYFT